MTKIIYAKDKYAKEYINAVKEGYPLAEKLYPKLVRDLEAIDFIYEKI